MPLYSVRPQGPCNSVPNKILRITSEHVVPFKCVVCVPNINCLDSKLREEIEVTSQQADRHITIDIGYIDHAPLPE